MSGRGYGESAQRGCGQSSIVVGEDVWSYIVEQLDYHSEDMKIVVGTHNVNKVYKEEMR